MKIRNIKTKLKWWNKNITRNVTQNVIDMEEKVLAQEEKLQSNWTIENNIELNGLQALHKQALKAVELFWREKSGSKFEIDSDKNTSYFHATVMAHRRRMISKLKLDYNSELYTTDKNVIHDRVF